MEAGELAASPSAWLMLLLAGPLVGQAFVAAVRLYAEASGVAPGRAALAQGLSPLDGIVVPTFGAYDLLATLLYPFVAIHAIAAERRSGADKLLLQSPAGIGRRLGVKLAALTLYWALAWVPGVLALLLWRFYGGHLDAAETSNLLLGHLLRFFLATGVAFAAAATAGGAASAALVALAFTLGTWALDFVAAGRGGLLERLGRMTPSAALRVFERGELDLSAAAAFAAVGAAGVAIAAVGLDRGLPLAARARRGALVALAAALGLWGASRVRASWDFSEDRRNSFSRADEAALRSIREPVEIEVALAPEDPRLFDYERSVLVRLRRVLPDLKVRYTASSRGGLFEGRGYGEIWYSVGHRRSMLRSTTEPIVLEHLYRLAGAVPPASPADAYPGHPLAARPTGAALLFDLAWPLAAGLAFLLARGPWRKRCPRFAESSP